MCKAVDRGMRLSDIRLVQKGVASQATTDGRMMSEARDVLLPVEDAKAEILVGISKLGAERISVAAAHGRVLAENLASRTTQPPKPVSAMDGYAVRSADVIHPPTKLKMIGGPLLARALAAALALAKPLEFSPVRLCPKAATQLLYRRILTRMVIKLPSMRLQALVDTCGPKGWILKKGRC